MNLEYVWTERAHAVLKTEAPNGFRFETTLPSEVGMFVPGDTLAWDWIADGQRFVIRERRFRWDDMRTCTIELLLDLPDQ